MNTLVRIAAAVAGLYGAGIAVAATHEPLPDGVALRELVRHYRAPTDALGYHYSGVSLPAALTGYAPQSSLGFVSETPFAGSRPLYACLVPSRYEDASPFTSSDANCEGRAAIPGAAVVGHVAAAPLAGTVPLYRCHFAGGGRLDHFDTLSDDCDGDKRARPDGVLGYVFL
ncbi:hypothetical protein [Tahibacter soli]|uniref:Uncharacterized protein n=1 Tax=Tahibacter soli TaxID=2983605 RepID=A0A9X3YLJ1_9GAMM|nr:hypothetical protein [Tahibacter soli]MDC8013201.1 hypothetical protein [Tahibacter soli]